MARILSLKSLNAFPHADEHLLKKTYSSTIVTILGLLIMITMFMHELQFYLTTYTGMIGCSLYFHFLLIIINEIMLIHVNMSFPSFPCE
ncbi:hypothetical protein ACJX0J_037540, partial [Zea mays]